MRRVLVCSLVAALPWLATAADGDLDASFGSGGKLRLPQAGGYHGTWMPTDVAVQSTGKIVISGWTDFGGPGSNSCFVLRLNANGTLDTTFGNGNSFGPGYAGYSQCRSSGVAVRNDDHVVVAFPSYGSGAQYSSIFQFSADGATFDHYLELKPAGADTSVEVNRIALDNAQNVIAVGSYTEAGGSNDFYVARVTADGSAQTSVHYSTYFIGSASPNSDIAYDLALAADGSYYVAGTTKSSAGDLDCGLSHSHYDSTTDAILTDATFGGSSSLVLKKDYGGSNDDYCFALALQPRNTLVLGGQSSDSAWQDATLTTQSGLGITTNDKFVYDQINGPFNGDVNTVKRVVVEPYDHRALLIGSGPDYTDLPSRGYDIGVVRFSAPSAYDSSFGSGGFAFYDVGSTATIHNLNTATSAVLWHDRLIIVGTAQDAAGGTDIVALRLAPFDGIFRNGFDG